MNSNVVVKDINLTKIKIRSFENDLRIFDKIRKSVDENPLEAFKRLKRMGFGKLLPTGFEKTTRTFAQITPQSLEQTRPGVRGTNTNITSTTGTTTGGGGNTGGGSTY